MSRETGCENRRWVRSVNLVFLGSVIGRWVMGALVRWVFGLLVAGLVGNCEVVQRNGGGAAVR